MKSDVAKRIESINNGIIPEGYKKTKVGIVPVEWEVVKLADIGKNYIGLTYSPEDTANNGLIVLRSSNIKNNKIDITDCVYVKCEVSDKNRVRTNDILICARNGSSSLIGKSALILSEYADFAFGAFMSVYRTKYFKYTFQVFQSFIIKKQILRNLGARINQITTADLNLFRIPFPPLPEQQKISEILGAQDKLIELQERKINQLKTLKKGYLQKMFPKKGSKYPELRFKGFTDAWEQREVKDIAENTYGGGTPQTSVDSFWNGDIPWIQSQDIIENQLFDVVPRKRISEEAVSKSATKLVPEKSIAIVTRVGVGKLAFMPFSYCTSQDFLSLSGIRIDEKFAVYSIYKMLQKEKQNVQGTSIKGITIEEMLSKKIEIPCNNAEQQQIGSYFRNLDHLITLHQRKLDEEKQKKKALMQLLLTGKVRVK